MVLKSSVALNNSGCIIAMKYGFSQGKASYPWVEKWFDRETPQVALKRNSLHIFLLPSLHEFLWKLSKPFFNCPSHDPWTLSVMSFKISFWIACRFWSFSRYKLYQFITHLLKMQKLIVALGKSIKFFTNYPLRNSFLLSRFSSGFFLLFYASRCWSSL